MKVLLLHQYFKTPENGGALRSYFLAKALVEAGIETVVITTHNHKRIEKKIVEGIEVHYLPIGYDNRFGFFKRVFSFLDFVLSIVRHAKKFSDADMCYAISTPLTIGLAAIWIKRRYSIPYYFEVGDLWPEAPIQMEIIRNPLLKGLLYRLEKSIYKRAEVVVALSDSIKTEVERKVPGKKIIVIPNMADTTFFTQEVKRTDLVEKFSVKGKFVVSYIGTLGVANGLDYVLTSAASCGKKNLPIHFIICGDGAESGRLQKLSQKLMLTNISFLPFQNREGVKQIMNVTDAILVCFQPLPILETGSPNKYFDGLAAGKLIVINFGGWMKKEIEQQGCGVYLDVHSLNDLTEQLAPFVTDPDILRTYQSAARKLAEDKYSRKILSKAFLEAIN